MSIDINELRRKLQSDDLIDRIDIHANVKPVLTELLDRLEAAERSDAESIAMYRKARDERDALRLAVRHEADCVDAAKAEIEALRAKIEAMERQVPVGKFTQHPSNGLWEQDGYGDNPETSPLYALPGAKGE